MEPRIELKYYPSDGDTRPVAKLFMDGVPVTFIKSFHVEPEAGYGDRVTVELLSTKTIKDAVKLQAEKLVNLGVKVTVTPVGYIDDNEEKDNN